MNTNECDKTVVTYFEILSRHIPEKTEETHVNPNSG